MWCAGVCCDMVFVVWCDILLYGVCGVVLYSVRDSVCGVRDRVCGVWEYGNLFYYHYDNISSFYFIMSTF